MRKQSWVVRVVLFRSTENDYFHTLDLLESFRYAGLISVVKDDYNAYIFDMRCPAGIESKQWAEMNAERMRSFGFNAQAAPGSVLMRRFNICVSALVNPST